jgi:hypothetical protein
MGAGLHGERTLERRPIGHGERGFVAKHRLIRGGSRRCENVAGSADEARPCFAPRLAGKLDDDRSGHGHGTPAGHGGANGNLKPPTMLIGKLFGPISPALARVTRSAVAPSSGNVARAKEWGDSFAPATKRQARSALRPLLMPVEWALLEPAVAFWLRRYLSGHFSASALHRLGGGQ